MHDGLQDWDCADSLDVEKFKEVLTKVKEGNEDGLEGLVHQGNFEGKMDGVHGVKGIKDAVVERLAKGVESWPENVKQRRIVIVDGFLLFGISVREQLAGLFDAKILLRARYEEAKKRRESRNGYVTLEGFWEDPPGYFDRIVWPNYVREHEHLFSVGDVGRSEHCEDLMDGVLLGPLDVGLEETLEWVVGYMRKDLEEPRPKQRLAEEWRVSSE